MPVEQPLRILTTTLAHPQESGAVASAVFAQVPRSFSVEEAMAELGFRTDAALTAQAREAPGGIPLLVGGWLEADRLESLVKTVLGGPDVAGDFAALFDQPCIVIEQSPPELASLAGLLKQGGGVAVGAFVGLHAASGPMLLVTVPAGIIIVGAAAGLGSALEAGLRDLLLKFMQGEGRRRGPASGGGGGQTPRSEGRGMAAG
jgi:hypothetical protein